MDNQNTKKIIFTEAMENELINATNKALAEIKYMRITDKSDINKPKVAILMSNLTGSEICLEITKKELTRLKEIGLWYELTKYNNEVPNS